ncbi:hypothetical protein [Actinopolymorpha cephalotaxi]|uniref:Uncharacterized protein n=1 Tax=Actinopolymorpha cephalotaxi TaxID=504797 RepID=A0ABX2S9U4_9ACTN|nr:hypothetical protein [Actinopolymorpha cephalotaxi]NYH86424.1 hypothetical protein [Actinopolymorpha cephalotaxi]
MGGTPAPQGSAHGSYAGTEGDDDLDDERAASPRRETAPSSFAVAGPSGAGHE